MADYKSGIVRGRYQLLASNVARAAQGQVKFSPVDPDEIVDVPTETLYSRQSVDATFDGDGWIHAQGTPVDYLRLPVGRWEVSFRQAPGLSITPFQFDVTADETVNLPAVAPIKPSPAVKFVVDELVYTETLDARDQALTFRNEAEQFAEEAQAPTNEVVDARIAAKRNTAGGLVGAGSDGRAGYPQLPADLSPQALSSTIGAAQPFIVVDGFRLPADQDDTASWQRAITAAIAQGVRRVVARKPVYSMSGRIDCGGAAGLTVEGLGRGVTVLNFASLNNTPIASGFYASTTASDLTFRDFTVRGTIVDDVTAPRRSRTESKTGIESGFIFHGDLNPNNGSAAAITNVTLERVAVEKTSGLPFQFDGVRGYAKAIDVETLLTMDGGWVFCQHVIFDGLRSRKSADNGFSISRGNQKVTGGSIYAETCAYYGAWFAGFYVNGSGVETGPENFTVQSIHVVDAGMGGVNLDNAPRNGKIGSVFVNGVRRGPIDGPSDAGGLGVIIGGYPSTNRNSVTAYAENIVIDNVDVIDCSRGGVHVTAGSRNIKVGTVTGLNVGSQYAADGTSPISSGDTESNYGVGVPSVYAASVSGVVVDSITFIDTRSTPYANFALTAPSSVPDLVVKSIVSRGARQGIPSSRQATVTAGGQAASASAAGNGAFRDRGTLNATAAAAPTAGTLVSVSYATSKYSSTPNVTITPTNLASAQCQPYVTNRSATGFTVACVSAPAAGAALSFDYHVTG